tara:strand:+ start:6282 stop:6653 length:372 start_codon:yes stop_codon:yes gene_type:complete
MAIVIAKDDTIFNCDGVLAITPDAGNNEKVNILYANGDVASLEFEQSAALTAAINNANSKKTEAGEAKAEELQIASIEGILPSVAEVVAVGNGADGQVRIIGNGMILKTANAANAQEEPKEKE